MKCPACNVEIKEYIESLKIKVEKSNKAYFEKDTPGTRSRYDYYQGKMDCLNEVLVLLGVEKLTLNLGR